MIGLGIFIIVVSIALLGFAGPLLGYSEKVKKERDDLFARQGSLTPEEKGRLTFLDLMLQSPKFHFLALLSE